MSVNNPHDSVVSTATLIRRAHDGDDRARADLLDHCVPKLQRWARGRMPDLARGPADTDDLVQTTVMRTLNRLDHLDPGETGSLLAYMRRVLINVGRDEVRKHGRRPSHTPLGDNTGEVSDIEDPMRDPAVMAAYENALSELSPTLRDAVILRVEFGMTFPEIAAELGLASANTARMRVSRGLSTLAETMPR